MYFHFITCILYINICVCEKKINSNCIHSPVPRYESYDTIKVQCIGSNIKSCRKYMHFSSLRILRLTFDEQGARRWWNVVIRFPEYVELRIRTCLDVDFKFSRNYYITCKGFQGSNSIINHDYMWSQMLLNELKTSHIPHPHPHPLPEDKVVVMVRQTTVPLVGIWFYFEIGGSCFEFVVICTI